MSPKKQDGPADGGSADTGAQGDSPAVLVAEDDVLVRMGVSDFLRLRGFTVMEAATLAEARALFLAGAPVDIVFSDIDLGSPSDGIELALWIEARHPEIPIVMTSGGSDVYRIAALACGNVQRFLHKPYDYAAVEAVLRSLFEAARKSAASR